MLIEKAPRAWLVLPLGALLVCAGCGGRDADRGAAEDTPVPASPPPAEVAVKVPDACSFFGRAELESIVGWELREGDPEEVPAGSACDFEAPPGSAVTRSFPDPALPRSVGFSSLTINTHPSNAKNFAEMRQTPGASVTDVPGVGDDAYFNGPDLLFVRVGNRGFSVRIYTDAGTDADRVRVREVMVKLGQLGASRLA